MISKPRMCRLAVAALPALLLMACADSRVPQMNTVDMSGTDFNRHLARNYKDLANSEAYAMYDWPDGISYADKAVASAAGHPPGPDDLTNRSIKGAEKVAELKAARVQLMRSLAAGAAQKSPENAAMAQAKFDCWAEQQEEGWQMEDIAACKEQFWRAMNATELAMAPMPVQAPVAEVRTPSPITPVVAAPPAAASPGPYLVFFNWDKSELSADATMVLDQAIDRMRAAGLGAHLVGHADASGTDAYNMGLSQRRADAVKNHLIARGISRNAVTTEARGERNPLIATADGVREPQNRLVTIDLLTRGPGV